MKSPDAGSRKSPATRREFLKTASATAGAAALGSAAPRCMAGPAESETIVIRAHHLFDMLDALGTGKSSHETLGPVALKIRANPTVPLKIVIGVDDICGPCERWDHERGRCKKNLEKYPRDNEESLSCDRNALRALGMNPGDTINADRLYRRIQARVTRKVFAEQVCVDCRLVDQCQKTYEPMIEAAVRALSAPRGE